LQALCRIFVERFARFGPPISHSIGSGIHSDFVYPRCHAALLSVIFAALGILDSIMSYGHFKYVIELDEFARSKFGESGNVNISISSMKIKIILLADYLEHHIVCIQKQIFLIYFISKDCISLQVLPQIVIDQLAWLGSPISRSISSDVHSHFICLTCHAASLPVMLISLQFILISLTCWQDHFALGLCQCGDHYPPEYRNSSGSEINMEILSDEQ
jgi:hypothetical protein